MMYMHQSGFICRCVVELYQHNNYEGSKHTIQDATARLGDIGFNDAASSAKISGTCDWLFYRDYDFLKDSAVLIPENYASTGYWFQSNDILSSLRPVPPCGTVAIVLYEHYNFEGRELVLYNTVSSLANLNDIVRSVAVTGGAWRLYQHNNFGGKSVTVGQGYTQGPGGNDYISSVKKL